MKTLKEEKNTNKILIDLLQGLHNLTNQMNALRKQGNSVESLVTSIDLRVTGLELQFQGMSTDFTSFKERLIGIESRLTEVEHTLGGFKYNLNELVVKTEENKQSIYRLANHIERAHDVVDERVTKLEQTVFPNDNN